MAWMIKSLKPNQIRATFFIDPICFMLSEPDVAYNFLYKTPVSWMEWILFYFAASEVKKKSRNLQFGFCIYFYFKKKKKKGGNPIHDETEFHLARKSVGIQRFAST